MNWWNHLTLSYASDYWIRSVFGIVFVSVSSGSLLPGEFLKPEYLGRIYCPSIKEEITLFFLMHIHIFIGRWSWDWANISEEFWWQSLCVQLSTDFQIISSTVITEYSQENTTNRDDAHYRSQGSSTGRWLTQIWGSLKEVKTFISGASINADEVLNNYQYL